MRRHTNTRSALCAAALLVAVVSAACSGAVETHLTDGPKPDASVSACVPGAQYGCTCAGGAQGIQVCVADGSGLGACACSPQDSGPIVDASIPDVEPPPHHDGGPDAPDASDAAIFDA